MSDQHRSFDLDDLVIDHLTKDDLDAIRWSGNPGHIRNVAMQLDRDAVEYLAVRLPTGAVVAKGMIDYSAHERAGTIEQLATRQDLQGRGIGSMLTAEAERRIRNRGCRYAVIGVEDDNLRARALYERLGYEPFDREHASWEVEDPDGSIRMYDTEITLLRKEL